MKVINKLNSEQYEDIKKLYIAFFSSINFENEYSEQDIKTFASKKIKDIKHPKPTHNYFYAINDDEMIGFIHGKIIDDIGLICHTYIKPEYRNTIVLSLLMKNLTTWFKNKNINIIESEISRFNPIIEKVEKAGWKIQDEYSDSCVFHKKI